MLPTQKEIGLDKSLDYPLTAGASNGEIEKCFEPSVQLGKVPKDLVVLDLGGEKKYVLDGHHRWSEAYLINPEAKMRAVVVGPGFAKSPKGALENLQLVIAGLTGEVPTVQPGNAEENIYGMTPAVVEKWIRNKVDNSPNQEDLLNAFRGALNRPKMTIDEVKDYLVNNAKQFMSNTKKASEGKPGREIMPQTDNAGTDNVKKEVSRVPVAERFARRSGRQLREDKEGKSVDEVVSFLKDRPYDKWRIQCYTSGGTYSDKGKFTVDDVKKYLEKDASEVDSFDIRFDEVRYNKTVQDGYRKEQKITSITPIRW